MRKRPTREHLAWARDYERRTGRVPFPFPQPQPRTPIRGAVVAFTFKDVRAMRAGRKVADELTRAFATYRAKTGQKKFSLKPKRNSRGVLWNGLPFYWCSKGYYRNGRDHGERRPLQHYIWEAHHGREMPKQHEIFFRDRDRHNFAISNLELLSKAELHKRTIALGETRVLGFEERSKIRGTWACKMSRSRTEILLANFQRRGPSTPTHKNNGHTETLRFLGKRRQNFNHGPRISSQRRETSKLKAA